MDTNTSILRETETATPPSEREIAIRAYKIFLSRGASHGHDLDDWLQAERELIIEGTMKARARAATA
jgi:Protein of unknown function (DUF2934)